MADDVPDDEKKVRFICDSYTLDPSIGIKDPAHTAPVTSGSGPTHHSPPAQTFPRWHFTHDEIRALESTPYKPGSDSELTQAEYNELGLGQMFRTMSKYQAFYGFKTPLVRRLKDSAETDKAIIDNVTWVRARVPKVPVAMSVSRTTPWGTLSWTPKGWQYDIDKTKDPHAPRMFAAMLEAWLGCIKVEKDQAAANTPVDRRPRAREVGALRILNQEGTASSINTWDNNSITIASGFANSRIFTDVLGPASIPGAGQTPTDVQSYIRKFLYLCGFYYEPSETVMVGNQKYASSFLVQLVDFKGAQPRILFWEDLFHFYGIAPTTTTATSVVRPAHFQDDADKGLTIPPGKGKGDFFQTTSATMGGIGPDNGAYRLFDQFGAKGTPPLAKPSSPDDATKKNYEILHAYVAITTCDDPPGVWRPFFQKNIEQLQKSRANISIPGITLQSTCVFAALIKHNWGMEGEINNVAPMLVEGEKNVYEALSRRSDLGTSKGDRGSATIDIAEYNDPKSLPAARAAVVIDAIIAKALARRVAMILEFDRVKMAIVSAVTGKKVKPVLLDSEARASSNLFWRYGRVINYWYEMAATKNPFWKGNTGEQAAVFLKNAVNTAENLDQMLADRSLTKDEVLAAAADTQPMQILTFPDGFDLTKAADPALAEKNMQDVAGSYYANVFDPAGQGVDDKKFIAQRTYFCMGPKSACPLPELVAKFGRQVWLQEVRGADNQADVNQKPMVRVRWSKAQDGSGDAIWTNTRGAITVAP